MNNILSLNKLDYKKTLNRYGIIFAFIALCLAITIAGEISVYYGNWADNYFLSRDNALIILRQVSINGILAIGMTFVIITAGVDLSVGAVLALAGIISARFATSGSLAIGDTDMALWLPVFIAIIVGALAGFINGAVIAKYNLQPFIVTMGMLSIARGLTLLSTDGNPVSQLNPDFRWLGNGYLFDSIPIPVVVFIFIFVIAWIILNKMPFGRYIYAVGGNEKSTRTSGINVFQIKVLVYTFCGVLAAIAGLILTARTGSAQTNAGTAYELDAIAAVVIGGTSMVGGVGTLMGTFFGILIIGVLNNGLDLLGVQSYYQQLIKGVLIVVAVMLDPSRKQRR
ncbi:ABC transporter permease [Testudinibacter sp. TR-2022]|uniref:ABC transporter permease n=1 Tax=Testudinibacter sp. TR-2022 TaxID=2585029 RepID=UPI001118CAFD|nr:ABC transporter permease [Testudinibacter sp. TR-2022]TNH05899.1 ABC transporter permease [Testudinibacter sp. TR-2022]TNH14012.1 ABC transporter permease [Testudinibacter sp. TR-2022]TNH15358.1 ABC transporter permease [Testudinibacter sp. TR-2022]